MVLSKETYSDFQNNPPPGVCTYPKPTNHRLNGLESTSDSRIQEDDNEQCTASVGQEGDFYPRMGLFQFQNPVEWLNTLTSEQLIMKIGSDDWYDVICDQLKLFLKELCDFDSFDRLYHLAEQRNIKVSSHIQSIEKRYNTLKSEVCSLLYLLKQKRCDPELNEFWLIERIKHFIDTRIFIENTYVYILFEIMWDNFTDES